MDFHPSNLPIAKTFEVNDEKDASNVAEQIVMMGFSDRKDGFKILMPKEKRLAQRIGYTITTTINYGLRKTKQDRNIRYWTFHQDDDHYAMVLIGTSVFDELGF